MSCTTSSSSRKPGWPRFSSTGRHSAGSDLSHPGSSTRRRHAGCPQGRHTAAIAPDASTGAPATTIARAMPIACGPASATVRHQSNDQHQQAGHRQRQHQRGTQVGSAPGANAVPSASSVARAEAAPDRVPPYRGRARWDRRRRPAGWRSAGLQAPPAARAAAHAGSERASASGRRWPEPARARAARFPQPRRAVNGIQHRRRAAAAHHVDFDAVS